MYFFFFFKQKTAYEMRISDWSSDVCSSDLQQEDHRAVGGHVGPLLDRAELRHLARLAERSFQLGARAGALRLLDQVRLAGREAGGQQQQTRQSDTRSDDLHSALRPTLERMDELRVRKKLDRNGRQWW